MHEDHPVTQQHLPAFKLLDFDLFWRHTGIHYVYSWRLNKSISQNLSQHGVSCCSGDLLRGTTSQDINTMSAFNMPFTWFIKETQDDVTDEMRKRERKNDRARQLRTDFYRLEKRSARRLLNCPSSGTPTWKYLPKFSCRALKSHDVTWLKLN